MLSEQAIEKLVRELGSDYEKQLLACALSAYAGAMSIRDYRPEESKAVVKPDAQLGHHAIVTDADYRSQKAILAKITEYDNVSSLMTEEHVENEEFKRRLIRNDELEKLRESDVYVIDELDGSSPFNKGHYEWSTSIGFMRRFSSAAGAVCAPQIYGGTFYLAARGSGAHVWRREKFERAAVSDCQDIGKAYVLLGPDVVWTKYPAHNRLLMQLGDSARSVNLMGSCAIGLGLVASGNADALIQPLISPWDWAAGCLLVTEAGGKLIFYEMDRKGGIKPIERLEPRHYNASERQVGFVAANERLADELMKLLLSLSR